MLSLENTKYHGYYLPCQPEYTHLNINAYYHSYVTLSFAGLEILLPRNWVALA
jgi:hypothetical protein